MSDFDHERVSALLNIVEKCAGHTGKLGAISNVAMTELLEFNENIKKHTAAKKADDEAHEAEHEEYEHHEKDGDPNIFTSDNPNPNLIDRRV